MYRLLIALTCATGVAAGCQEGVTPAQQKPADPVPLTFNVEQNPTLEFRVPGIHCQEGCRGANEVLAEVPGVVDVYASEKSKRVIVAIDMATFDQAAAKEVLEAKFGPVTEVTNDSRVP